MKTGRPRIPDNLIAKAIELRAQGVPWSEVEVRLRVSRRTVLRKAPRLERGQNTTGGEGR